ncbi:MAG TPA: DnaB-like helicase C-terminal domain-containing protein [Candidatus Saccharimonadales bacterium]|nr:DnaB-like helicase C-terminal domain-containing protein [Candidatus Saccharimonadales bacterium]
MARIEEVLQTIEKEKDTLEVLPTGFKTVDNFLDGGFIRKEFVVIGAKSGEGKSYLSGQIFQNIAKKGFNCAYFSLEISNEMIVSRLVGAIANIKPTRIRLGLLKPEEYNRKLEVKTELEALTNLITFEDSIYELESIITEIREKKYDFIVVDFLQNVMVKGERDEYSRLSKVAIELQKTAKELNCVILGISQVSNKIATQGSDTSTLEYKGSGNIHIACDLGFYFGRVAGALLENSSQVQLFLKKNRRGIADKTFNLYFKIPGGLIYEP